MDAIFRISHEYSSKQQIGGWGRPSLNRRGGDQQRPKDGLPEFAIFLFKLINVGKENIEEWKKFALGFRQLTGTAKGAVVHVQQDPRSPDVTEIATLTQPAGEERSTSDRTLRTRLVNTVRSGMSSARDGVAAVSDAAGKGGNLVKKVVERRASVEEPVPVIEHEFENPIDAAIYQATIYTAWFCKKLNGYKLFFNMSSGGEEIELQDREKEAYNMTHIIRPYIFIVLYK